MRYRALRPLALALAAPLALVAVPAVQAQAQAKAPAKEAGAHWAAVVARNSDGSYTLGNPAAKVKLTEYVSYTCSHCAHFHAESDAQLRQKYLPTGTVSVTVQQFLRNPVDITVAMLTNCGDPKRFFRRHGAFMATQSQWMAKVEALDEAAIARWNEGDIPARLRRIATDLGFYATMAQSGYTRAAVDACLSDDAARKRLEAQTKRAQELGVRGTPSFAINGSLLDGIHDWAALAPKLDKLS